MTTRPALAHRKARPKNGEAAPKPAAPPEQKKWPRQSRSRFTVDAILEAAEQLLDESGTLDAITTRRVAQRAGVGIGTLYEYFPNREAILIQLINRSGHKHIHDAVETFQAAAKHSLGELFHAIAEYAVATDRKLLDFGEEFHRRYARHYFTGRYFPESNLAERDRFLDTIETQMAKYLQDHRDVLDAQADINLAAFLMARGVRSMMATLIEDRPELMNSPQMAATLERVMLAIVGAPALPLGE